MEKRFYASDEQVKEMTEKIITILNGVPVWQATCILHMAKQTILDCLTVDTDHPRFKQWKGPGPLSL